MTVTDATETSLSGSKDDVLRVLRSIEDPDLGMDIVTLGFIQNMSIKDALTGAAVSFEVELTTPACPIKDDFRRQCEEAVRALSWVESVDVTMTAQEPVEPTTSGLRVSHVIAVASCKGGVGKSTVATNLAFALSRTGARVGILDADIFGPSLPTMAASENEGVRFAGGDKIYPFMRDGVKMMSYGFINPGAAVYRGPMIASMVDQLVTRTEWGSLDYLVVDMPPGTGDIQLTLCQTLEIRAAVLVTNPTRLSFVDVVKGVDMFDAVNVPTVAVVENFASFAPPAQDIASFAERHGLSDEARRELDELVCVKPFGEGFRRKLQEMWGIQNAFALPLVPEVAARGDSGTPFVLAGTDETAPAAAVIEQLATGLIREASKLQRAVSAPTVSWDEDERVFVVNGSQRISGKDLRYKCRCAACVDEFTGQQKIKREDISDSIAPIETFPTGNYALTVRWNDGHQSLYPYARFIDEYTYATYDEYGRADNEDDD
jgi:Mrp family chromosome partitioning ATPase